ncbi:hypothetical protein [Bacillus toyonensis]|uniref:hypothetical protein n=1 Tax=Bacillus toyonensis TaxID=155322 RepID=UPI000BF84FA0|nr:hypothetical protein [Bacillus toyonensis]PGF05203.1 hypothetical protein COM61_01930 [Bacillus toyonensis]
MYHSRRDVFDGLASLEDYAKIVELMLKLEGEKLKGESIYSAVREIKGIAQNEHEVTEPELNAFINDANRIKNTFNYVSEHFPATKSFIEKYITVHTEVIDKSVDFYRNGDKKGENLENTIWG